MKEKSRVFGNNLRFYLEQRQMQPKQLALRLGYSEQEIWKIMDARLFPDNEERKQIAEALNLPLDVLYQAQEDKCYEKAGCFECRGEFSDADQKKQIFDLFDIYCDIQEVLVEEGLKPSH